MALSASTALTAGVMTILMGVFANNGTWGIFTDFSDDLTDLNFNHKGVFFNFIATH